MKIKAETGLELPEGLSALPPTQDQLESSDGEPSDSTCRQDQTHKKEIYERHLRVPEYFWFHPTQPELFAGFHLVDGHYQPIEPDSQGRLVSRQLDLLLVRWMGRHPFNQEPRFWLRWAVLEGTLLPTEEEQATEAIRLAEQERQIAEQERQKAQYERERALALAAKLRALGVDPEI